MSGREENIRGISLNASWVTTQLVRTTKGFRGEKMSALVGFLEPST
jgi:hypothetical protein